MGLLNGNDWEEPADCVCSKHSNSKIIYVGWVCPLCKIEQENADLRRENERIARRCNLLNKNGLEEKIKEIVEKCE